MNHSIDDNNNTSARPEAEKKAWGPRLFIATLLALLTFFYWLLIYSGGVVVHHG